MHVRNTSKLAERALYINQYDEIKATEESKPTLLLKSCFPSKYVNTKVINAKRADGKRAQNSDTPNSLKLKAISQKPNGG